MACGPDAARRRLKSPVVLRAVSESSVASVVWASYVRV